MRVVIEPNSIYTGRFKNMLILFTHREMPANPGYTGCFHMYDGHGEASQDYVKQVCRKPKSPGEKELAKLFLSHYKRNIGKWYAYF